MTSKARAPSPSASFYDVSDDEEGEYNTIAHASVMKGVKLLFSKSKVYVHPTPSAKDNIPGFIALVQQKSSPLLSGDRPTSADSTNKRANAASYLLAWVPESSLAQDDLSTYVKVDMKDGESPPRQSYLVPPLPLATTFDESPVGPYAFSLPLSSIYSIHVRPPSLGWWYGSIVINTRAGSSLPALFFHDSESESTILQKKKRAKESFDPFGETGNLFWGGDEVLRWLKRYVEVERSTAEPSIYLINPTEEDRTGFGQGRKSLEGQDQGTGSSEQKKKTEQKKPAGPGMDPVTKALKETRWKILEQLSKVTTFTRRTAEDLVNNKNIPPQVRRFLQNPEVQTLQDEFDSAKLYLARWAMSIAEQSEREKNNRIWTARDVLESEETSVGDFEILDMEAGRLTLSDSKRRPVNMEEWQSFFDSKGRLQVMVEEVKERVFHGGLDSEDGVRKEAWPFLLGVYEWDSTEEERNAYMNKKRDEYIQLKGAWWDRMIDGGATPEQEEWWKEQKNRIEKDVHRTDRHIPLFAGEDIPHPDPTSPFYNSDGPGTNVHMEQLKDMLLTYLEYDTPPTTQSSSSSQPRYQTQNPHPQNLGYVQGMSDLLSPLYAVFQDDAIAFWAFVSFMRRMSRNFVRSQSGMRAQLNTLDQLVQILDPKLYLHLQSADSTNFFFFFRMLLVWYKREFDWSDTLRLWELLWTDFYSSQFHLFIAVAILEKHRDVIMDHLKHFDEILKYINELSGTIELQETLFRAESLFKRFEKTVEAVDRKSSFPAPNEGQGLRQRKQGEDDKSGAAAAAPAPVSSSGQSSQLSVRQRRAQAYMQARQPPKGKEPERKPETEQEKVITPDLRLLLSKKIVTLDEEVGGDDAARTRASGLKD
ncbi:rab-GTPase-TBC domain-containing protein [Exophiala viscosa]|uniref:GTPase-activating protein GYP7 n=1 Tax=Exophiala viscosa TaxID=2486360 RepID=A0AAN6E7B8_9EURO|nr:rab-GTPase-TBC domain-containing protein [Exophiala viscosa]